MSLTPHFLFQKKLYSRTSFYEQNYNYKKVAMASVVKLVSSLFPKKSRYYPAMKYDYRISYVESNII